MTKKTIHTIIGDFDQTRYENLKHCLDEARKAEQSTFRFEEDNKLIDCGFAQHLVTFLAQELGETL